MGARIAPSNKLKKVVRTNVHTIYCDRVVVQLQMDVTTKIQLLERALASQQLTLRLQATLAAILFLVGITLVISSFVSPGLILVETVKTGQALGGAAVAASGILSIFFCRRDKVVALRSLLHSYQHQQVGGLSPDPKLDQYFYQYFHLVLGE